MGFTKSSAYLGRDSSRVITSCSCRTGAIFAESLLSEGDPDQIKDQAAGLAHSWKIVESEEENQISASPLNSDQLPGESLPERGKKIFDNRLGKAKTFERAVAMSEALNTVCNNEIPLVFEQMMQRQVETKLQATRDKIREALSQRMRKLQAFWQCWMLLTYLKVIAEGSTNALLKKLSDLQELMHPHEELLDQAYEQLQQLQEQGLLSRSVNRLLVSRICTSIEQSSHAVIDYPTT